MLGFANQNLSTALAKRPQTLLTPPTYTGWNPCGESSKRKRNQIQLNWSIGGVHTWAASPGVRGGRPTEIETHCGAAVRSARRADVKKMLNASNKINSTPCILN